MTVGVQWSAGPLRTASGAARPGTGSTAVVRPSLPIAAFVVLLLANVLVTPMNHDESQYVAGANLAIAGRPFRDFLTLQPPLAIWFWAPIAKAAPGWSLAAIRLSSALFGLLTLWAVHRAERLVGVPARAAIAVPLLACCQPFLFTSAVARNDALPGALLAMGMVAGLRGLRGTRRWLCASGLLFGLAAATKLSFLPPLVLVGLALPLCGVGMAGAALFACGAILAGPCLLVDAFLFPEAYRFGVIDFAATAPFAWYGAAGLAANLTVAGKLASAALALADGPALEALALAILYARRGLSTPDDRLLAAMMLGGLLGALLPTPMHKQYLLPALPPILVLASRATADGRDRAWPMIALAVSAAFGIARSFPNMLAGPALLVAEEQAHAIGDAMRTAGVHGIVASLSPELVADSGEPLDPRFATGAFVFRSGEALDPAMASRLEVATPGTLDAAFALRAPAALLVGYEQAWRAGADPVDAPLERWAVRNRYRPVELPDGRGRLYLRPPAEPVDARSPGWSGPVIDHRLGGKR